MPTAILDTNSLARTLRNLELTRLDKQRSSRQVRAALDWVVGRLGADGAYRGLFAPTELDVGDAQPAPTGERGCGTNCTRHILGEEATRALLAWKRLDDWPAHEILAAIRDRFNVKRIRRLPGYFCCPACAVSRWRVMSAGRPEGWESILELGLQRLAAEPIADNGCWRRFPFYYTLLALSEMPLPEAAVQARRVRAAARRAAAGPHDDTPQAFFRRRAIQWALGL
jgi:hypothetical protein